MGKVPAEDLACVSQVLQGDAVAAEALVERLRPLVVAIARRRLPERVDEADLIQSVFLRVFTNLEHYAGRAPLEHWVSRIAVNTCLNELRYERNRPELRRADLSNEQDEILDVLTGSETEVPAHRQVAARELVEMLLGRLPPRESLVIKMLYLEGHTQEEIHKSTGWSQLAVRLLAFRARTRMKKALKHLLKESPR
jgi:RNA polymerase sigma-70 factor (ECF subfamily)